VVPGVGDEPYAEGWVGPLNAAIYPAETTRRSARSAAGCPAFKSKDTVLNRPGGDPASARTVCPGEHRLGEDGAAYDVVWWSPEPGVLELEREAPFGLRRDDLIVKEVAPEVLAGGKRAYRDWRQGRDAAIVAASTPSVAVRTATEAARGELPALDDVEVAIEQIAGAADRPGGTRFGTLVHALLADVPLAGVADDVIAQLASAHGRVLGADASEIAAAQRLLRDVLAHPRLVEASRAAAAGRCYRETPITWRLDDGAIVEGTVDLAYDAGEEIVVVDFKTDRELRGAIDEYERQIRIYAAAVGAATGRRARGVLLRI
jgi:ATP-dependent helicase/nuclease subunit A